MDASLDRTKAEAVKADANMTCTSHVLPFVLYVCLQGAGNVDDSLDRTKAEAVKADASKAAKPLLPPRPAGKGKGKR